MSDHPLMWTTLVCALLGTGCGQGVEGGSGGQRASASTTVVPGSLCRPPCPFGEFCEINDPFGFWNSKSYRCIKPGGSDGSSELTHTIIYGGCYNGASDSDSVSGAKNSDPHGSCGVGRQCQVKVKDLDGVTVYMGSCRLIDGHQCSKDADCIGGEDCQQQRIHFDQAAEPGSTFSAPGVAVYGVCVDPQPPPSTDDGDAAPSCAGESPPSCGDCGYAACVDGLYRCQKSAAVYYHCGSAKTCQKQGSSSTSPWTCVAAAPSATSAAMPESIEQAVGVTPDNDPVVEATGAACPAPSYTRADGVTMECWRCAGDRAEVFRDGAWTAWNVTAVDCNACNGWLTNSDGASEAYRHCRPAERAAELYADGSEPVAAPPEQLASNNVDSGCSIAGRSAPSLFGPTVLLGLLLALRRLRRPTSPDPHLPTGAVVR